MLGEQDVDKSFPENHPYWRDESSVRLLSSQYREKLTKHKGIFQDWNIFSSGHANLVDVNMQICCKGIFKRRLDSHYAKNLLESDKKRYFINKAHIIVLIQIDYKKNNGTKMPARQTKLPAFFCPSFTDAREKGFNQFLLKKYPTGTR